MKILEFALILSVGLLSGVFVDGCIGDEGCTVDAMRCATAEESSVVEICRAIGIDLNSRALDVAWTNHEICEADEICIESTGVPESARCACTATATRCSADWTNIEICNDQRYWEVSETCSEGTICEIRENVPVCIPGVCTNGTTQCSADNSEVETCSDNQWTATETCDIGAGEVCEVVGETAQCVATSDGCTADDAFDQRCNPDDDVWIQECQNVGTTETPKYEWRDIADCSVGGVTDEVCVFDPDDPLMSFPVCAPPPT